MNFANCAVSEIIVSELLPHAAWVHGTDCLLDVLILRRSSQSEQQRLD
jgi:hypothetical protein